MLSQNQRVILGDALSTLRIIKRNTFAISDKTIREEEQTELIERIADDIRTVLRIDRS